MEKLADNIIRIQKMEQYFDEVIEAVNSNPNLIHHDVKIKKKLQELIDYYESGLWGSSSNFNLGLYSVIFLSKRTKIAVLDDRFGLL